MHYTIRTAVRGDFPRINGLFIEMLNTIYQSDNAKGYAEGELDYYFSGGDDVIFLAEDAGVPIAFLSVEGHHDNDLAYIYLDDFSVSAQYRSRGIGAALLRRAEQHANAHGYPLVYLHVEAHNRRAYRFYTAHGFCEDEVQGSRIRMKKAL